MKDFKKYTKEGRRVAAIAEQTSKDEIRIFILLCSPKNHFVKKVANDVYKEWFRSGMLNEVHIPNYVYKFHPQVVFVKINEGDTAEFTFHRYMQDNFYKKVYVETCTEELRIIPCTQNPVNFWNKLFS